MGRKMRKEDILTNQISNYLQIQYPKVIFHFDLSSGGKTSIGMAVRNKKINPWRGYPDLFICQPTTKYAGLFIELKVDEVMTKKGYLKKNKHIEEQFQIMQKLSMKGYTCMFGVGFEKTKNIIDNYLKHSL